MLDKRWKLKPAQDDFEVRSLADSLNISEVLAKLLILRDVKTFAQAKKFFRPTIDSLYDPFKMHGMDIATSRVIEALTNNEKIMVYGDYDVDGTCSTALMYMFLKELGADVEYYIPSRLKEGYGISELGIDYAKSINTKLMISVDCGITAVHEADYAKKLGVELIICDHHQAKDILPDAYAVLDPIKPECNYPFKFLSGAGVAFKLAQGISERIGRRELPLKYLDLVALAGAADIVPIIDENRILVMEGLRLINENPRAGVKALLKTSHVSAGNLSSVQIVFTLAPRINAVGRLGDAKVAVELMTTEDDKRATELASVLESDNFERRKIDEDTLAEALDKVNSTINFDEELAIVLHGDNWHPGVIGIVASRLVEKYYRPTIMLTTIDGVAKGSARSITNFNIYEALKECEDLLIHFGGHEAAAGLAVELDKFEEFKETFNRIVREKINHNELIPEIVIDSKVRFAEFTPKFLRIINQFAPFGPGNMRPSFLAEEVEVSNTPRIVGNNHLLMSVRQKGCDKVFDSIGFDLGNFATKIIVPKTTFDMVFSVDQMTRDGKSFPQLKIKDIKIRNENHS
jgi:single-stranded-DNA-specific exonuclease